MRMSGLGGSRGPASRDASAPARQQPHVAAADLSRADDAQLVPMLASDARAVEEFYRRHVRPLTRYVRRRLPDDQVAADIVAAAFLAAIESSAGYDPERGRPSAWLHGIANNLLANEARRQAIESRAVARLGGQQPVVADEYDRVEEHLDARRRAGPISAVLAALPDAERELVDLLLHAELTVTEAAQTLGIRPATARMRLARARGRLRHGSVRHGLPEPS